MPRTGPEHEPGRVPYEQLGEALGVEARVVAEYVELGFVRPRRRAVREPLTGDDIARLSRALRLARELELHAAAAAMLVELLEERDALLRRVACLERLAGGRA
jgi:hypothetical protein